MSHFSVLVVSEYDVENVMAQYNEEDDEFFTAHDVTEDTLNDFEKYKSRYAEEHNGVMPTFAEFVRWWNNTEVVVSEENAQDCENERTNYALVDENDNCVRVVSFWNDNAKYDYYLGASDSWARWDYSDFIFKNPSFNPKESPIRVSDIDIDAMVKLAFNKRANDYDKVAKIFDGTIPTIRLWESFCKEAKEKIALLDLNTEEGKDKRDKIWDEVRAEYHAQEAIIKFKKSDFGKDFWGTLDEYQMTREEYINEATLPFFSIVTEDGWFERAKMGWWAVTYGETMTKAEWREKQISIFKDASEDAVITLLDCHI